MKTRAWLSPRECEVLLHLAHGSTFKWAAVEMHVSPPTAKTFAQRAYRKLGAADRREAVSIHPHHKRSPNRACLVVRMSSKNTS